MAEPDWRGALPDLPPPPAPRHLRPLLIALVTGTGAAVFTLLCGILLVVVLFIVSGEGVPVLTVVLLLIPFGLFGILGTLLSPPSTTRPRPAHLIGADLAGQQKPR